MTLTRAETAAIRVRISHAFTQKSGWVCDGTTVEWCGELPADWEAITEAMREAYQHGQHEADLRNAPSAAVGGGS